MTTESVPQESPRQRLDQLRLDGADAVDPVGFRYLDALERRLRERGLEQGRHWEKLRRGLADYEAKQRQTGDIGPDERSPERLTSLSDLTALLNAPSSEPAGRKASPLSELLANADFEPNAAMPGDTAPSGSPRPLKAAMRARALQGERTLERRIQSAIEQSPANAGPMNAHRLVSRALGELQRLSPAYLKRFASYTDLLQSLEKLNVKS